MSYKPGVLQGGRFQHDCPPSRALGYYLEVLLLLGPFCERPLEVTLTGVTNDDKFCSVDIFRGYGQPGGS